MGCKKGSRESVASSLCSEPHETCHAKHAVFRLAWSRLARVAQIVAAHRVRASRWHARVTERHDTLPCLMRRCRVALRTTDGDGQLGAFEGSVRVRHGRRHLESGVCEINAHLFGNDPRFQPPPPKFNVGRAQKGVGARCEINAHICALGFAPPCWPTLTSGGAGVCAPLQVWRDGRLFRRHRDGKMGRSVAPPEDWCPLPEQHHCEAPRKALQRSPRWHAGNEAFCSTAPAPWPGTKQARRRSRFAQFVLPPRCIPPHERGHGASSQCE